MHSSFYAVEGIDGSGKTGMAKYAGEYLDQLGIPNLVVEAYPRDENSMFLRDLWIQKKVPDVAVLAIILELRKRVMQNQIIPALLEGKVVITDRWHESTWTYQGVGMKIDGDVMGSMMRQFNSFIGQDSDDANRISWLYSQIVNYNCIYLDIDVATSRGRVGDRTRAKDAIEKNGDDFFENVLQGFHQRLNVLARHGQDVTVIDARGSIEKVREGMRRALQQAKVPVPPQ